jgi:glycosyltransferase involved in cell wall biosynthesis
MTLQHLLDHRINGYHLFPGMIELMGVRPNKSIVLPLWIDTSAYNIGPRTGKARFFYAAQLKEGKGIITLIEAWKMSGLGENPTLEICGWGPLSEYLKSMNLKGVIFRGYVSDKELRDIYSLCDIFLYPTRGDNYGFTVLKALASGMYVLTSEILSGLFDEYESAGYLEYVGSEPEDYAKIIIELAREIDIIRSEAKSAMELTVRLNEIVSISKTFFDFLGPFLLTERIN